ncbi:MAG: hypothetical protein JNL51_10020 [Chitinophagaceae bacterium]|nr:hypothetical protein [Chitinophagaceae bacterium]
MKSAISYPHQNLDLSDIKGEQWEDIPGLDGYYCISTFGRAKRLEFEILCSNGYTRRLNEKILTPGVEKFRNHTVNDQSYFLRITIMQSGVVHNFSVPRLVYHCFVKSFDMDNLSLVVIAKDGNGKNIKPGNLMLVNLSQKQKRIFDRHRLIRNLPDAYEEFINQGAILSSNPFCKQISQYTLTGKKIQTFPGTNVAARILNISEVRINSVLKGRQISSGGYVWRYGKERQINMQKLREEKSLRRKLLRGQKVTQYSAQGMRIAIFLTISDAAKKSGLRGSDISVALSGKQKSAGGFIWRKGWGNLK